MAKPVLVDRFPVQECYKVQYQIGKAWGTWLTTKSRKVAEKFAYVARKNGDTVRIMHVVTTQIL